MRQSGVMYPADRELQKKYGVTQILCWTRLSGLDNLKVLRSMELMQRHVIPHFKRSREDVRIDG